MLKSYITMVLLKLSSILEFSQNLICWEDDDNSTHALYMYRKTVSI